MTSIWRVENRRLGKRIPCGLVAMLLIATVIPGGCDDEVGAEDCVLDLPPSDCTPLYTPTFDEMFAQTLEPKCAVAGGACHASTGAKGGLILDDADAAYEMLLNPPDAPARVLPGDPECSPLIQRVFAEDATSVMPPGNPLASAERCAIVQWIRNGAER
jgi:hypothetical protein